MSKSLQVRLKATIVSPAMLISVCIGVFMLTWQHIFNLVIYNLSIGPVTPKEMGYIYLDDIYGSHALSGFDLFAPILAVLPASTLFCEDYNSGYIKSILNRVEKKRYMLETVICSSIAGGLAILLPSLITSIFYIVNGIPNTPENAGINYFTVFDESVYSKLQFVWGGMLMVILLLVLAFLFGAVWSNIGLCISTFIPNRYITLAAPFALYFITHLVFYRIGFLLVLSPVNMLMPAAIFIPSMSYPFIYQIVLFFVIVLILKKSIKGRLSDV